VTPPDDVTGSDPTELDPLYVEARRVLLDALTALEPHDASIVVAGAQAIYLRTGAGDIAVAPYTTDGDVVVDPTSLSAEPQLEAAMLAAGFHLAIADNGHVEPGIWVAESDVGGEPFLIPVDLIVPEGNAPPGGRRGARLGPHGNKAARRARGLEAALVDKSQMTVSALDAGDQRSVTVDVAGEAALLVAKAHKLHDRVASGKAARVDDKDAADVVRLMQVTSPITVGATLTGLLEHPIAGPPTADAVVYLDELFGRRGRPGIQMAARALRVGIPEERVEAICVAYIAALLDAVGGREGGPKRVPNGYQNKQI
jgi:ribosomal protein L11